MVDKFSYTEVPEVPEENVTILGYVFGPEKSKQNRITSIITIISVFIIIVSFVAIVCLGAYLSAKKDDRYREAKAHCLSLGYAQYWLDNNTLYCSDPVNSLIIEDFSE